MVGGLDGGAEVVVLLSGVDGLEEREDAGFELLAADDTVVDEKLARKSGRIVLAGALLVSSSSSSSLSFSTPFGYSSHDSSTSSRVMGGRPSSFAARDSKQ